MPLDDRDKLNKIEELKRRLFSKNFQTKIEHRDKFTDLSRKDVPDVWQNEIASNSVAFFSSSKFFMKTSIFKKFFAFSLGFFILTLLYASYVILKGGNTVSNENIAISIIGNSFTAGGEELSFIVSIANKNNSALDLVDLVMEYPKNSKSDDLDIPVPTERSRFSLGTIPAGATRNENLKVVLFGEQNSVRTIKISLEYRVEGSNAIFVKEKSHDVAINSTPINITLDAPVSISSNQDMTLDIKLALNSSKTIPKILLSMDYPVGFQFKSAIPSPSLGNNVWSLGDMAPGVERSVAITGRFIDAFDGEEKIFNIKSGSQSSGDKSRIDVIFNSLSHLVSISKPFIETKFFVDGIHAREYAVDTKTSIRGTIQWQNNLETKVNDLRIRAKISGNAVNRRTINVEQGFYNSSEDVIVWDKNYQKDFGEVSPGESGSVNFSLSPLALFSATGGILAEPSIFVDISISGKQLIEGYETVDLNSSESSTIKIISDVGLATKALYYSGPITNKGPIPPRAEEKTTYTISWSLSNTANNISKSVVKSSIPQWVSFIGATSPASENLTYNASTREIVWNVGTIPKGSGITQSAKEVAFQVSFLPSLSQVGTAPVLINDVVLTGHDDFANVDVRTSKASLTTQLFNDTLLPPGGGVVVE